MSAPYKIDTALVMNQIPAMSAQAVEIRSIAEQIQSCKNQLRMTMTGSEALKQRIDRLFERALDSAVQMDTLKEALEAIVQVYAACEGNVLNNAAGGPGSSGSSSGMADLEDTDKRSWWQRLVDWFFRRDVDRNYTHTGSAQEAAADARMQQQIQALSNDPNFTEAAWRNATPAQRRDILRAYMREVMRIMDVDVNPSIDFSSSAPTVTPTGTYTTNGSYNNTTNRLYINGWIIDNASPERSYQLMTTMVHELRHAYQWHAIQDPTRYQVSQETIDRWSDSFRNYRSTDRFMRDFNLSQDEAYRRYRAQAIEVDARAFAGQN